MVTPRPGSELSVKVPPARWTRSRMLASPTPASSLAAVSANPRPESVIVNTSPSSVPVSVTRASLAPLCLTTLFRPSWTTRNTQSATSCANPPGTFSIRHCT